MKSAWAPAISWPPGSFCFYDASSEFIRIIPVLRTLKWLSFSFRAGPSRLQVTWNCCPLFKVLLRPCSRFYSGPVICGHWGGLVWHKAWPLALSELWSGIFQRRAWPCSTRRAAVRHTRTRLFPLQPENTRIIFLKDCGPPVALATVFSAENNVGHPEVIPEVSGSL